MPRSPRLTALLAVLGCAMPVAHAVCGAAGAASAAEGVKQPQTQAGPFTIMVDRINQNRQLGVVYGLPRNKVQTPDPGFRRVQLQMTVKAPDRSAASSLAAFSVGGITAVTGGRAQALTYSGGPLETNGDTSVLRAYLYISQFPAEATEIRAIEGELVAYERAADLDLAIPVSGQKPPVVLEKDGVKATVKELNVEAGVGRLTLLVEAPAGALVCGVTDGTFGVSMTTTEGRIAPNVGGTLTQSRPNLAEYKLQFQNVRAEPATLRVRLLHRSGQRKSYPFRLERVPIPARAPLPAPGEGQGGK